ncbi:helix-turn-helix domain-containing protein [Pseudomonas aeruginosa]|nr:helix-turn-helix domain-containing protein [Pseudomonas aeruginosa]MCS7585833.1 helix-turn-helix domain-containing protein [Pseudomonas aeruginosa]MCS7597513.1 helix-turn-helix domain-containing protein [Pseudomonas aeruginosa]MCS7604310.1 helix-turn-helix domain-containing protein [Pseudomonas aeruginosa]MCS8307870.1 helix-turn-helix domain-containing protein [Pseudomonas aeruginosa]
MSIGRVGQFSISANTCGISQDALALACSIDRSYMGRIERGEVNITVEKLYRIASELACDPSCLMPQLSEL